MTQPLLFQEPESEVPRAIFSPCSRYRYFLSHPIRFDRSAVLFCMANPSVADGYKLDPTVRRCVGYARAWGYGALWVVNTRAYIGTDPDSLPPDPEAIGPENDRVIAEWAARAALIVCGWGELAGDRGPAVLKVLANASGKTPHALAVNASGAPSHPLYLAKTLKPFPLEVTA